VARVLEALERRGRLDRTILLLVADHGESLYDHGELLHGDAYWDGVINVPMVMKVPGLAGQEAPMDALVSHPDILPTLLELVGAVVPAGVDGQSMLPLLTGEADQVREIALSEGGVARQIGPHPRGAVIAPPWIMLRQERGCGGPHTLDPPRENGSPATCLYQMEEDPLQERSVALQHPEVTQELLQRWAAFRLSAAARSPTLTLDPRLIEELRRTGYDFRSPSP
jgi:arylsulfatase A-like enzyme